MVQKIIFIIAICVASANSKTYDLKQLLDHISSEGIDVKIAKESATIAEAQKDESKSTIYPSLRLESSFVKVDQRASFGTGRADRTIENVRFVAQQRLFRGLGEFHELDRLEHLKNMQNRRLDAAKREVHRVIIDMCSEVWWQQARLKRQLELVSLSKDRESVLKQRVNIGRSRPSELLNAQSQKSSSEAQLFQIKQSLEGALINLKNVTLIDDIAEVTLPEVATTATSTPLNLSELGEHPSMLAADDEIHAWEKQIKVNNAYHWPQIDLRANAFAKRADVSFEGSDWDLGVFITWPLFEGQIVSARNRQVYAQKNQAVLQKERQKRQLLQISDTQSAAYQNATKSLVEAKKSADLQKTSYDYIKREYIQGLANQLEVNQSMNLYIQGLLLVDESQIQVVRSYYQSLAIKGTL
jgi:outer membrane protein TolC